MLKITVGLISGALALCQPLTVFADPKSAPPPQRILVMLQTLKIPAGTAPVTVSDTVPASETYKSLLQNAGAEATEISIVTPADFPGSAQYNRVLTFMALDHGKPSLNLITAPTMLKAPPHINPDGTITVRLDMEVMSFVPPKNPTVAGAVPNATSQRITTTRTFRSGKTAFLDGVPQIRPGGSTRMASQSEGLLQFVTVIILPDEKVVAR